MTTYAKQQAAQLIETGECDLPLTWDNIAHRVAQHDTFSYAIKKAYAGHTRMLEMLVVTAAVQLCKEQDNEH